MFIGNHHFLGAFAVSFREGMALALVNESDIAGTLRSLYPSLRCCQMSRMQGYQESWVRANRPVSWVSAKIYRGYNYNSI